MSKLSRNIDERRVILIGKTGNGKSSTGNTLLGYQAFLHGRGHTEITKYCLKSEAFNSDLKLKYTIIDTPGLMDAKKSLGERALEIQRSLEICPNPHAFLLVFNSATRFTKEDDITVDLMRVIFGEGIFNHCIIVFTRGGEFESELDFEEFWTTSDVFLKLAERCGNRVTRIENRNKKIADHILAMIEDLCDHGKKTYKYTWISTHKRALSEHWKTYDGQKNFKLELNAVSQRLGTMLNKEIWTAALVGGVAIGAGAFGVGAAIVYGAHISGSAVLAPAIGAAAVKGASLLGGAVMGGAWKLASSFRPQ